MRKVREFIYNKKHIIGIYVLVFVVAVMAMLGTCLDALAASASLTGPDTVRAGDTITLTLNISDTGKYGLEGTLNYDSSQVTLQSMESKMSGWKVESNGNSLIVYDDAMANPINGGQAVLTLKFKVSNNLATGTNISISIGNIVTTDGNTESNISAATYSVSIARPLSGNANLSSLTIKGYDLSPAFSAGTTSYSLGEVDYSVSKLEISYKTEDSNAKVNVSKNTLNVGKNTITITVTAENGATKEYKVTVTRKQDPNYKQNNNADLKSLTVNMGMLSPEFKTEIGAYVVYLPFECVGKTFKATGTMSDGKAQGATGGTIDALVEGMNTVTVVGVAEDGTEKTYTITVVVMPKYEGGEPETVEPTPGGDDQTGGEGDAEVNPDRDGAESDEDKQTNVPADKEEGGHVLRNIILIVIIVILAGGLVYVLFFWGKEKNR